MKYITIKTRQIIPLLLPCLFFLFAMVCLWMFDKSFTMDGYLTINTSRAIRGGYGYTGHFSEVYPPLYAIITSLMSVIFNPINSAKIISVVSASSLLIILPYLSFKIGRTYIPGLYVQLILVFSPNYLQYALTAENYFFGAFLFAWAVYLGINQLTRDKPPSPMSLFVLVTTLAILTRLTAMIIPVVFIATLASKSELKLKRRTVIWLSVTFILACSPWFFYRLLQGKLFYPSLRWNVIGLSFINNGLVEFSTLEWVYIDFFNYESIFDFIFYNPETFGINFLLNTRKTLNLLGNYFSPLGFFSWTSGAGLIYLVINSDKKVYMYLLLITLAYGLVTSLTITIWFHYLNLCPVLATLGIQWLQNLSRDLVELISLKSIYAEIVLVAILILPLVLQQKQILHKFDNLIRYGFRLPQPTSIQSKIYLENQFDDLRQRLKKSDSSTTIMSTVYLNKVYQAGFEPIMAPPPSRSIQEVLCYKKMSKRRYRAIASMNFPPTKPRSHYVPADYFLVDSPFLNHLSNHPTMSFRKFRPFLKKVDWWVGQHGLMLYKISKNELQCERNSSDG